MCVCVCVWWGGGGVGGGTTMTTDSSLKLYQAHDVWPIPTALKYAVTTYSYHPSCTALRFI